MADFTIDRHDKDGWVILAVGGDVDLATAPALRQELADLIAVGVTQVVLDLSATSFLDSTGLGAIVMALKRIRAHGGSLRVVATSPNVQRVFEITSLDKVLDVRDSVDAAVAGP